MKGINFLHGEAFLEVLIAAQKGWTLASHHSRLMTSYNGIDLFLGSQMLSFALSS